MNEPAFIGVDWGTSRLRAFMLDGSGNRLKTVETEDGLLRVRPDGFDVALARAVRDLGGEGLPVVMSGMVGARQGWAEAPYVDCPAGFTAVADHAVRAPHDGAKVLILAGVASGRVGAGRADVMRGEETEIAGAMSALSRQDGVFVLPGTHTKWATVDSSRITDFRTFMTGDVFAALKAHTVLSAMMGEPDDWAAFDDGVAAPGGSLGEALSDFFALRAEALFGRREAEAAASHLSGRLIGAEIEAAHTEGQVPILVGGGAVLAAYERAFQVRSIEVLHAPKSCAAHGLALAARYWGWI